MSIELVVSPHGHAHIEESGEYATVVPLPASAGRIRKAFDESAARGLLHLATSELQSALPPGLGFARDLARLYLTRLCHTPPDADALGPAPIEPPTDELDSMSASAPPMRGMEYIGADVLSQWWRGLDELVAAEARQSPGGIQAYLRELSPVWRMVGRVTFHLAENKRDARHPFAFMASYASRVSSQGRVQHLPLARALQEYSGAKNKSALLSLLMPIQRAAERSELVKELVDTGKVYHPLAWSPRDAYRFLQQVPVFEESGLVVRVPDWWKANRPPRPVVSVKVGDQAGPKLGADALLDFSVNLTLEGEPLSELEIRSLLQSGDGLVALKGKWIEVDREKLEQALSHWKQVERQAKHGGISFFEGMRLLSGAVLPGDAAAEAPEAAPEWTGISAGEALEQTLESLRDPESRDADPPHLLAELRPYQKAGVNWLRFMTRLGLGACLADDMGLGKTIQVIALMLHRREQASCDRRGPSLLVVPASLIANWKSEISRFAPNLSVAVAHPSELPVSGKANGDAPPILDNHDLVITTYGMLPRLQWLRERQWDLVVLDEAQAIKNTGARQTRTVKELKANGRIALTGTPVENRLSDLWSLFDFLNPGLLGGPKAFSDFTKKLEQREHNPYGPLRSLVRPYILRRLKTDKRIIADLPDKTEVNAWCGLTRRQAVLYEQAVRDMRKQLESTDIDGIKRRGVVLGFLMRFKQICNHPSQLTGDREYGAQDSAKFQRLVEICQELAERQEKALVFTQFREVTEPLAELLAGVFGRQGLVLHGQTPVPRRSELVEAFSRESGPPFFVLSLKAGGTGLNLTEASHVIHFDRWWNPAVENQATDRAFRIGQKKNVLVHKFVCRGTVEEKIDELIAHKSGLARDLLDSGAEGALTEMDNDQLLRFVALDINKALEQ